MTGLHLREGLKKAIEKAEEVNAKYNPQALIPFPFNEIVKGVNNLKIIDADLRDIDDNISGVLVYEKSEHEAEDGVFKIFINTRKPKNRRYFTLAHEMGHYFLHKKSIIEQSIVVDKRSFASMFRDDLALSDEKEVEANYFAAALIMPNKMVIEVWKLLGNISECAKFFQVSITAMTVRLDVLGLIE